MVRRIANTNNETFVTNSTFTTEHEKTSAGKRGFSLIESLVAFLIICLFFTAGLTSAKSIAGKIADSEAFFLDGDIAVAQLLYEDAGYDEADIAKLTDAQIRSIYGEDLDSKRVDIVRRLAMGELDLKALSEELKETGWSLSDSEVEALQEMTNGMFTDEQIRAYYGINPEDYTSEGMMNPSYFDYLNAENIQTIVADELQQDGISENENVSSSVRVSTMTEVGGSGSDTLFNFFNNLFFGESQSE